MTFVYKPGLSGKTTAAITADDTVWPVESPSTVCAGLNGDYTVLQAVDGDKHELARLECLGGVLVLTRGQYETTAYAWPKGTCWRAVPEPCSVSECTAPVTGQAYMRHVS